ncbi:MAG: hypothetical protein IJT92_03405 [Spirochaetia bacterium]|nr:hypothetical protein [Spirochaetia bacterium]
MCDNSKEALIAKYTDKSRYKPEHIYGDVYVDKARIELSKTNDEEKEIFYRELNAAKRFSKHFNCEVFLLPPYENGHAIYLDKHSNPDSIIKGLFIDFKQAKNTDTSITRQLERGLGQAEGVIITINGDTIITKVVQWLNGKINTMTKPHDGFIVVVENNKGSYWIFTIKRKRLSIEENLFSAAQRHSPPGN